MAAAPGVPRAPPRWGRPPMRRGSTSSPRSPATRRVRRSFSRIDLQANQIGRQRRRGRRLAERAAHQLDALVEDGSSTTRSAPSSWGYAGRTGSIWPSACSTGRSRSRGAADRCSTSRTALDLRPSYTTPGTAPRGRSRRARLAGHRDRESWLFARGVKPLLQSLALRDGRRGRRTIERDSVTSAARCSADDRPRLRAGRVLAAAGKHAAALEAFDDALRGAQMGRGVPSRSATF